MKMRRIILAGAMTLSMILVSGAIAFAASDDTAICTAPTQLMNAQMEYVQGVLNDSNNQAADDILTAGTLTDDESDAILEFLTEDKSGMTVSKSTAAARANAYADLTDDQRIALKSR